MRIGLAYNQKPDSAPPADDSASHQRRLRRVGRAIHHRCGGAGSRSLRQRHPPRRRRHVSAKARPRSVPLVFNMAEGLHGQNREAHVPAICEYLNVPYTAATRSPCRCRCTRRAPRRCSPTTTSPRRRFAVVTDLVDLARVRLPYPLFVKPVAEGSGKGIFANNLCHHRAQLRERVSFLLETYKQPVLVETYLPGPEFTVAILGNGAEAYCLPIVGFDFSTLPPGATPVYGYEAKWIWDTAEHPLDIFECPAKVPEKLYRHIEIVALDAYHALGCRDWCRIDVRVDEAGVPNVRRAQSAARHHPRPADELLLPQGRPGGRVRYDELIQEVVQIAWRRLTGRELVVPRRRGRVPGGSHRVRVVHPVRPRRRRLDGRGHRGRHEGRQRDRPHLRARSATRPEAPRPPRHALVRRGPPLGPGLQSVRGGARPHPVGGARRGGARVRRRARSPGAGRGPSPPAAARRSPTPSSPRPASRSRAWTMAQGQDRRRLPAPRDREARGRGRERRPRPRLGGDRPQGAARQDRGHDRAVRRGAGAGVHRRAASSTSDSSATACCPVAEIDFTGMPEGNWPILTYAAKWHTGSAEDLGSVPVCPAPVSAATLRPPDAVAELAWRTMQGKGYGRVDLRVDDTAAPGCSR